MERIDRRNLYKNLITYSYFDLNPIEKWIFVNLDEKQILSLESRFYEEFGWDIFIDIYPIPKMEEHNVYIISDEGVKRLDEVSPLAQSLKPSEMRLWNISIYAPKEKIKELRENNVKDRINKILKELDVKVESKLIDILKEYGTITGKRRFLEIAKERGISPKEFYNELHKLIFCGLIKERFNRRTYVYCLNNFVKL